MGKKRGKDKGSKDDDDIELTGPSCRHIKKGTDQTLLKKLSGISIWTSCQDCKNDEDKENINTTVPQQCEEENETAGVWMCLKCGHRGCGRNSENKHAIKHYETPHSDPHCLVVSLDNWSVWCYLCDDEVHYSAKGQIAQLVSNLKKQTSTDPTKRPQKRVKEDVDLMEEKQNTEVVNMEDVENTKSQNHQKKSIHKENVGKSQSQNSSEELFTIPVKGLSNLGNTCFFNAVIQNLSQTHHLREILNKVTEEKVILDIQPDAALNLEPIQVHLDQPGSLTLAMCKLLNEIQESKKNVVTPRDLFTQVCKKAARFKGFQQQDSQELLRYLLDGMRSEEVKRVSSGLMEAVKRSNSVSDEEHFKTLAKEYDKSGVLKNFVDQVFGGEVTSTIMCQQCKTVSVVTEMFLDLSLPVSDEAYRKKNQKKFLQKTTKEGKNSPDLAIENNDIPTGVGSKYQQKKAKKQAKKQAKNQKRQQKLGSRVSLSTVGAPDESQTDVTKDLEQTETADGDPCEKSSESSAADRDQSMEEEKDEKDSVDDSDSTASNRFAMLSEEQDSSLCHEMSSMDLEEGEDAQLSNKMKIVTLDDAFIEDSEDLDRTVESEEEVLEEKEYTVINQDPEQAFCTLATRSSPQKQECSVQSCLFQFTEAETLTENNSLLCVTCTRQQKNKDGAVKKNVYTDALKQMLISSLPPVLTLHLKRFQQNGYSICKVNRHIEFPLVFDLAPYCAAKCKNISEGHTQILYNLYGVVEHSGTMRSGHYTAYVKVRPELPKLSSNGPSMGDVVLPGGSWFHISDTSVQPVSESKVQSCQAYLLFYERIV